MADNKKSFILYSDLITVVKKLVIKDREDGTNNAGELFLHVLEYVNDLDPIPINFIVDMASDPIKASLKRDLEKWDEKLGKKSEAGLKSAGIKAFNKELPSLIEKGIDKISSADHLNEYGRCMKYMAESHGTHHYYYYEAFAYWHKEQSTKTTPVESVENNSTKSTVNVNVNDNVTVNDILLEKETKDFNFKNSLLDYGFEKQLVDDWLKVRKTKKATNTETSYKAFIKEIEKCVGNPNEILSLCIEKDWKGFKSSWIDNLEKNEPKSNVLRIAAMNDSLTDKINKMYPKNE